MPVYSMIQGLSECLQGNFQAKANGLISMTGGMLFCLAFLQHHIVFIGNLVVMRWVIHSFL